MNAAQSHIEEKNQDDYEEKRPQREVVAGRVGAIGNIVVVIRRQSAKHNNADYSYQE